MDSEVARTANMQVAKREANDRSQVSSTIATTHPLTDSSLELYMQIDYVVNSKCTTFLQRGRS
jgi:hypothetical protein